MKIRRACHPSRALSIASSPTPARPREALSRRTHARSRTRAAALACLLAVVALACGGDESLDQLRALQAKGDFTATVEPLRRLVDAHPDDPEASYLYGIALLNTGAPDRAIWAIRKAAASPAWKRPAGLALANAAFAAQEWENAIRSANELLEDDPDDVDALLVRANARLENHDDLESVIADLDRVIELRPDDVNARIARVSTLIAMGRVDEAAEGITALEDEAKASDVPEPLRAQVCAIAAAFANDRGRHDEAKAKFEACLEQFPRNMAVVGEYVDFLDQRQMPEAANAVMRATLEQSPNDSSIRLSLSRRLVSMKRYEESEALLRAGTQLSNRRAAQDSWAGLADHFVALDDLPAAAAAYEKSYALIEAPTAMDTLTLGDVLARAGRNDEALEVAQRLENDAYRGLIEARVHLNRGDPAAALARLDDVLPLWPNNPGARYWAARAAERMGDFDRAIAEYRQSVRSNPAFSDAGLRLALILEAEGRGEDAWAAMNRFVGDHRNSDEGAALSIRLASRFGPEDRLKAVVINLRNQPTWPAAVAARAEYVASTGNLEGAVKTILEGSDLDLTRPGNARALRSLVLHLNALDRGPEALELVDRALARSPDADALHEARGAALALLGRDEEAREAFERALAIDARNALAHLGIARLDAKSGDLGAALVAYDRAAHLDPDLEPAYAEAALRLAEAGRGVEAEARWAALLDELPHDATAALALARLRHERGLDDERTVELARRAVHFRAGKEGLRLLATVLDARGETDRAREVRARLEEPKSAG